MVVAARSYGRRPDPAAVRISASRAQRRLPERVVRDRVGAVEGQDLGRIVGARAARSWASVGPPSASDAGTSAVTVYGASDASRSTPSK